MSEPASSDPNTKPVPKEPKEPKATDKEYELAAGRYNEIYKAVWQNFSYMAVLSGAILTFGKDKTGLGLIPVALIACIPLLVWYWATFEPLNRYGTMVEYHLTVLEKELGYRLYTELYKERLEVLRLPRRSARNKRSDHSIGAILVPPRWAVWWLSSLVGMPSTKTGAGAGPYKSWSSRSSDICPIPWSRSTLG